MRDITLHVSFDIDQEGKRLNWEFLEDGEPMHKGTRMETGMFVFEKDWNISLLVTANSYKGRLVAADIIDCHIVTVPILQYAHYRPETAGLYPYPSPFFDPAKADCGEGGTIGLGRGRTEGTPHMQTWTSTRQLVCRNQGRWGTSLYMTAAITDNTKAKERRFRVFVLDPESQVSTGAFPPGG
jgi:hypothetical protein